MPRAHRRAASARADPRVDAGVASRRAAAQHPRVSEFEFGDDVQVGEVAVDGPANVRAQPVAERKVDPIASTMGGLRSRS